MNLCGPVCPNQVSVAWISNYTPQVPVACNYLFMPQIPGFGTHVHIYHNKHVECHYETTGPHVDIQNLVLNSNLAKPQFSYQDLDLSDHSKS